MILSLNCINDSPPSYNKADYLMRAAGRLGMENVVWREPSPMTHVLNIEPYGQFVRGSQWTGIWSIDLLINAQTVNDWHQCDDIFMAISTTLHNPGEKGHLLFQAADPVIHKRMRPAEVDFVVCGTTDLDIYTQRRRCHDVLQKAGFRMLHAGKGHTPVTYVDHMSKGRVQFIRSMEVQGEGEIAQRFFECLAIGPVLTNYVPDLEHTGLIESLDYFSYRDDTEMVEKMQLLVQDPELATRMAYRGRQKALLYHSYDQRLAAIFNILYESKSTRR